MTVRESPSPGQSKWFINKDLNQSVNGILLATGIDSMVHVTQFEPMKCSHEWWFLRKVASLSREPLKEWPFLFCVLSSSQPTENVDIRSWSPYGTIHDLHPSHL